MGGCSLSGRACSDSDCVSPPPKSVTCHVRHPNNAWKPSTTIPQRCCLFLSVFAAVLYSSVHFFLFFFVCVCVCDWDLRRGARMRAGREAQRACFCRGSKMIQGKSRRLWCFLAGFKTTTDNLMIWKAFFFFVKAPAHPGPSCLALQWQTL